MNDIAVAILTALAGFAVWIVQRNVERREAARLRREKLYATLLSTCAEFVGTGNLAPFVVESQRAWLYGSDEVLQAINAYQKACAALGRADSHKGAHREEWAAVLSAEAGLRSSIRKELFPKTAVTAEWVEGHWESVSSRPERIQEYLRRRSALSQAEDAPDGPGRKAEAEAD